MFNDEYNNESPFGYDYLSTSAFGGAAYGSGYGFRVNRPKIETVWASAESPNTRRRGFSRPFQRVLYGLEIDSHVYDPSATSHLPSLGSSPRHTTANGDIFRDFVANDLRSQGALDVKTEVERPKYGRITDVEARFPSQDANGWWRNPENDILKRVEAKRGYVSAKATNLTQADKDFEIGRANRRARAYGTASKAGGGILSVLDPVASGLSAGLDGRQERPWYDSVAAGSVGAGKRLDNTFVSGGAGALAGAGTTVLSAPSGPFAPAAGLAAGTAAGLGADRAYSNSWIDRRFDSALDQAQPYISSGLRYSGQLASGLGSFASGTRAFFRRFF